MTTAWLLIVPMPLELMLPLMTLSQPTPRSRLQGDSAGVVCACAAGANPIHAATEVSTTKDFQVLGVIGHSLHGATSNIRTAHGRSRRRCNRDALLGIGFASACSGVRSRDVVTASPPVVTPPPAVSG